MTTDFFCCGSSVACVRCLNGINTTVSVSVKVCTHFGLKDIIELEGQSLYDTGGHSCSVGHCIVIATVQQGQQYQAAVIIAGV